jgi:hypothetical protein
VATAALPGSTTPPASRTALAAPAGDGAAGWAGCISSAQHSQFQQVQMQPLLQHVAL